MNRLIKYNLKIILCLQVFLVIFLCPLMICWGEAPTPADKEELRRRTKQEAVEWKKRQLEQDTLLENKEKIKTEATPLPVEELSFPIHTLRLEGAQLEHFSWLQKMLDPYVGQKIGKQGINIIVKRLSSELINRGYITSRIVIPEQDVASGTLRLFFIPGTIRNISFSDPKAVGNWSMAFPCSPGDILNLRDLEQGLEQMKRVPSQDVDFKLVPGEKAGESDVLISIKRQSPWRRTLSLDDSGNRETGKLQLTGTIEMDNLFGINDSCYVSLNRDMAGDNAEKGTRGSTFSYSMPYGYWTFSFLANTYKFHQTIQGDDQTFLSSGDSDSTQVMIERLISRDQKAKTSLQFRLTRKNSRSYIDDAEIEVQQKKVTIAEAAIQQRIYRGKTVVDAAMTYKWGVPWFGAKPDIPDVFIETNRYKIWMIDVNLRQPISIGNRECQYSLQVRGQTTKDRLFASEFFGIGNRYTVRGFDGEQTLAAEKGWYIRNEVAVPLDDKGNVWYLGLDYGRVMGPYTKYLSGTALAGLTLGVRGKWQACSYDLFLGCPINKPNGFEVSPITFGFQLSQAI